MATTLIGRFSKTSDHLLPDQATLDSKQVVLNPGQATMDSVGGKADASTMSWAWRGIAVATIAAILALLPGLWLIRSLVQSDYVHQLIALERFDRGLGFTSLQPVAPEQPWEWQYDYGFLTRWPIGYPLLVWVVKSTLHCTPLDACRWISIIACAAAFVGWFTWIRACLPRGVASWMLALVAASSAVNVGFLVDPSTDLLVIAVIPYALLLVAQFRLSYQRTYLKDVNRTGLWKETNSLKSAQAPRRGGTYACGSVQYGLLLAAGVLSGGLFWIRYASLFMPMGILVYLALEWMRRRISWRPLVVFALGAGVPIISLISLNVLLSPETSIQSQFNLGSRLSLNASIEHVWTAWWTFTDFGYFAHHGFVHWFFALAPLGVMILTFCRVLFFISGDQPFSRSDVHRDSSDQSANRSRPTHIDQDMATLRVDHATRSLPHGRGSGWVASNVLFSTTMTVVLITMLIGATVFFGDKFNYVGLERYYWPCRPLYFVLFVGPLLAYRLRMTKFMVMACCFVAMTWVVEKDWMAAYRRTRQNEYETTPYGSRADCFSPGAGLLYDWLKDAAADEHTIMVSNFRESLALETGHAALPIPKDVPTLNRWITWVCEHRGIRDPKIWFVLDPDNRWRSYWLPPLEKVQSTFSLTQSVETPKGVSAVVYKYGSFVRDETEAKVETSLINLVKSQLRVFQIERSH